MERLNETTPPKRKLAREESAKRRERRIPKYPIWTEDFALRIKAFAGNYPDDTRIIDLRIPDQNLDTDELRLFGFLSPDERHTPDGWVKFYSELEEPERNALGNLFNLLLQEGIGVIGDVRGAQAPELVSDRKTTSRYKITLQKAEFIKKALEPYTK